jgi:hypothetical protein
MSDSSSDKLSGVGGPRGPKKGRGYAAVDCLVNRGDGKLSRVPAIDEN